jgi:hypothetical protein
VDAVILSGIWELLAAVERGYDIIHLFTNLEPSGLLVDHLGATLRGCELIEKCCERDVKLLWIANDNRPADYVKAFTVDGRPLNLIMTMGRGGAKFRALLDGLLHRISSGQTLPIAWAGLVPQACGSWQQGLPDCVFFAGRPDVKLLP